MEVTESGYMDSAIFFIFLFFQKNRQLPNETCVLILDGHLSHISFEVLKFAKDNKIELMCYLVTNRL